MEQMILVGSLLGWGLLFTLSRLGPALFGDFSHRLEYGLRGNVRPPFGLWCLIVLAFGDTLALMGATLMRSGAGYVAASTVTGLLTLLLLWISLDWSGWRQGWLEGMVERPEEFWPWFDRLLWVGTGVGIAFLGWAVFVLRDCLLHSKAM